LIRAVRHFGSGWEKDRDNHIFLAGFINNHTCIQFASSFSFSLSSKTRGNSRKLDKSHVLTVHDGHSFAKRIVNT